MAYRPILVTPATGDVLALAEIKAAVGADGYTDQDTYLQSLARAATAHLELLLGIVMLESQWTWQFDDYCSEIRLPFPVVSVDSVTVTDADGSDTVLDDALYSDFSDSVGNSFLRFGSDYPTPTSLAPHQAYTLALTAGGTAADVPEPLKLAIKLLTAHWFNNREAVGAGGLAELPLGVTALVSNFWRPTV